MPVDAARTEIVIGTNDPPERLKPPAGFVFLGPSRGPGARTEMTKRIEVGLLGATGMVGQQFINQLAGHPWFSPTWLAASERSEGKSYADAAPWRLDTPMPAGVADARWSTPAVPGQGPEARLLRPRRERGRRDRAGVRRRRPHRREQRAQPPHGPRGAAARAGGQRRAPRRSSARSAARGANGGAIVTNPNCSTVVLTMALAPLRAVRPQLVPRDDDAGGLRRRLSGRAVARHPRQRHPVHRRRGGEDRDARRRRSSGRSPARRSTPHPVDGERAHATACP